MIVSELRQLENILDEICLSSNSDILSYEQDVGMGIEGPEVKDILFLLVYLIAPQTVNSIFPFKPLLHHAAIKSKV